MGNSKEIKCAASPAAGYLASSAVSVLCGIGAVGLVYVLNGQCGTFITNPTTLQVIQYSSYGLAVASTAIVFGKTATDVDRVVQLTREEEKYYRNMAKYNKQMNNSNINQAMNNVQNVQQENIQPVNNSRARILGFDVEVGDIIELKKKKTSILAKYCGYTVKNGINHYRLSSEKGNVEVTNDKLSNEGYKVVVHRMPK